MGDRTSCSTLSAEGRAKPWCLGLTATFKSMMRCGWLRMGQLCLLLLEWSLAVDASGERKGLLSPLSPAVQPTKLQAVVAAAEAAAIAEGNKVPNYIVNPGFEDTSYSSYANAHQVTGWQN